MNLNAFDPTADTVPLIEFRPALSATFGDVRLLISSVLSVVTSILVNTSTETDAVLFTGEISSIVGDAHCVFAKSSVTAVLLAPLGHVMVTVVGCWLLVGCATTCRQ